MNRPKLNSFPEFPPEIVCPVCRTNEPGETVLVPIDGTTMGRIAEAQPIHLACCIPDHYSKSLGVLYRRVVPEL